ncbi:hypothetical protein DFH09DRAFT_1369371 [Mycena vulgaris]|nr:hypothetical protein DFH09DRAFT_1369371 [Mycena vulgaris]
MWCSGTGGFDDPDTQEAYVSKFLPPTLSTSSSGRLLMARIWRWLHGRHRYTASLVYAIMHIGFETPHSRLDDYIKETLDWCHSTLSKKFDAVPFSKLSTDDKQILFEILFRYMATHEASPPFGPEQIKMVSNDYALFVDDELSRIIIDEPLVLIGAARKLSPHSSSRPWKEIYPPGQPNNYPETFVGSMRLNPPQTPQALSHVLVFYISRVPAWAKQSAQLVKFHRDESLERGCSRGHDFVAGAPARYSILPAIVLQFGPFFTLKLADGSFIWVALKAIPSAESIPDSELKTAISQLAPDDLFADEGDETALHARAIEALQALPQRSSKVGKHSLLRVVCVFPADLYLDRCVTKRSQDVAGLSLAALEGAKDEVTQPEFFDAIIAGVLAGQKRKSPSGGDERPPPRSPKRRKSADHPTDGDSEPTGRPVSSRNVHASPDGDPDSAMPPKRMKGNRRALADEDPAPGEPASPPKKRGTARVKKAANAAETSAPVSRNTRSKAKAADKSSMNDELRRFSII